MHESPIQKFRFAMSTYIIPFCNTIINTNCTAHDNQNQIVRVNTHSTTSTAGYGYSSGSNTTFPIWAWAIIGVMLFAILIFAVRKYMTRLDTPEDQVPTPVSAYYHNHASYRTPTATSYFRNGQLVQTNGIQLVQMVPALTFNKAGQVVFNHQQPSNTSTSSRSNSNIQPLNSGSTSGPVSIVLPAVIHNNTAEPLPTYQVEDEDDVFLGSLVRHNEHLSIVHNYNNAYDSNLLSFQNNRGILNQHTIDDNEYDMI